MPSSVQWFSSFAGCVPCIAQEGCHVSLPSAIISVPCRKGHEYPDRAVTAPNRPTYRPVIMTVFPVRHFRWRDGRVARVEKQSGVNLMDEAPDERRGFGLSYGRFHHAEHHTLSLLQNYPRGERGVLNWLKALGEPSPKGSLTLLILRVPPSGAPAHVPEGPHTGVQRSRSQGVPCVGTPHRPSLAGVR